MAGQRLQQPGVEQWSAVELHLNALSESAQLQPLSLMGEEAGGRFELLEIHGEFLVEQADLEPFLRARGSGGGRDVWGCGGSCALRLCAGMLGQEHGQKQRRQQEHRFVEPLSEVKKSSPPAPAVCKRLGVWVHVDLPDVSTWCAEDIVMASAGFKSYEGA